MINAQKASVSFLHCDQAFYSERDARFLWKFKIKRGHSLSSRELKGGGGPGDVVALHSSVGTMAPARGSALGKRAQLHTITTKLEVDISPITQIGEYIIVAIG